jgi:predicted phosphatase
MEDIIGMEFESSNGTIYVDEKGNVLPHSELSDWLEDIKRVDIEELDLYYAMNGLGKAEGGDVLDFGYWDKDDKYHAPSMGWRSGTFHNQALDIVHVSRIIDYMVEWGKTNRIPPKEKKEKALARLKRLVKHELNGVTSAYLHDDGLIYFEFDNGMSFSLSENEVQYQADTYDAENKVVN